MDWVGLTPPASGPEQEYAEKAAKTIRDRVKRRKDWLQVVENKDEAEILVEVYSQRIGQGTSQSTISGQSVTNTSATETDGQLGVRVGDNPRRPTTSPRSSKNGAGTTTRRLPEAASVVAPLKLNRWTHEGVVQSSHRRRSR